MDYETVIGLETHVQLKTETKLFCACPTKFGAEPNSQVCPVCCGMPGTLPVINRKAVDLALQAALALSCEIADFTKFDRKNYFYPDLPKDYQISQYDLPFSRNGHLTVETASGPKKIRIHRAHMEEDAGKLVHPELGAHLTGLAREEDPESPSSGRGPRTEGTGPATGLGIQRANYSLVDLNRCGVPLLEIVTEPDIRSPAEAHAYLDVLKAVLQYVGVSDCDMEKGSLRCDANVSIRPRGAAEFGVKVEIKNLNSFRFLQHALEYEVERQIAELAAGGRIVQETRTYDAVAGVTKPMRSKEMAHDYRYFPEPDLCPVTVDTAWIARARAALPELPQARRERFVREYGLPDYDAGVLTSSRELADYFEEALRHAGDDVMPFRRELAEFLSATRNLESAMRTEGEASRGAGGFVEGSVETKSVANWVMGEVLREMKEHRLTIGKFPIPAARLVELARLLDDKKITNTAAKEVFATMMKDSREPSVIVAELGLAVMSDTSAIETIVDRVIAANPKPVADYRGGKKTALGALVGQVMRESKGKASPSVVQEVLGRRLAAAPEMLMGTSGSQRIATAKGTHPYLQEMALCYLYDDRPEGKIFRKQPPHLFLPKFGCRYRDIFLCIQWSGAVSPCSFEVFIAPEGDTAASPVSCHQHDFAGSQPSKDRLSILVLNHPFPRPGSYEVRVKIGERVGAVLPLRVEQAQAYDCLAAYIRDLSYEYEDLALRSGMEIERLVLLRRYPVMFSGVVSLWGGAAVVAEELVSPGNEVGVSWTQYPIQRLLNEKATIYVRGAQPEDLFRGASNILAGSRVLVKAGNDPSDWDLAHAKADAKRWFDGDCASRDPEAIPPPAATVFCEGPSDAAALSMWSRLYPELVGKGIAFIPVHGDSVHQIDLGRLRPLASKSVFLLDSEKDSRGKPMTSRIAFREKCRASGFCCYLTERGCLEDYLPTQDHDTSAQVAASALNSGCGILAPVHFSQAKKSVENTRLLAGRMTRTDLSRTDLESFFQALIRMVSVS